jgi:hypothetical protein
MNIISPSYSSSNTYIKATNLTNLDENTKKIWLMTKQLSARYEYCHYNSNLIYQFDQLSETLKKLFGINTDKTDLHEQIATLNDSFKNLNEYLKEIYGLLNEIEKLLLVKVSKYAFYFDFDKIYNSENLNYKIIDSRLDIIKQKYEKFEKEFDTLEELKEKQEIQKQKIQQNVLNNVTNFIKRNLYFRGNDNLIKIKELITTISLYEYEVRFNHTGDYYDSSLYTGDYYDSSLIVRSSNISSFFFNLTDDFFFDDIKKINKEKYKNDVKEFCYHFRNLYDIFNNLQIRISRLNMIIEQIITNYKNIYFINKYKNIENEEEKIDVTGAIKIINEAFSLFKKSENSETVPEKSEPDTIKHENESKPVNNGLTTGGKKKSRRRKRTRRSQNQRRKPSRRYKNAK